MLDSTVPKSILHVKVFGNKVCILYGGYAILA